jgi:hypothetical protein
MELEARKKAIDAARAEWESLPASHRTTMTIQFHGVPTVIPVIRVSPNAVLLNHDNYRLAAQLEDHPDRAVVTGAPLTPESQTLLAKLLSSTEEFKSLKSQLADLKQRDPGLITREGLLVNGNTRAVALRELGSPGMIVGLLPDAVNNEDVLNLQVELQMVRLVHQDYTFSNELLIIDKLRSLPGADIDGICRKLGLKVGQSSRKKVEQKARILKLIKEIRSLHTAGMLPFSFFDTKREMLENLDTQYEKLKETDFGAAETLKWARVAGMLYGLTKDQVRAIDPTFIQDEIRPRIPENPEIAQGQQNKASVFGSLDELGTVRNLAATLVNEKFDETGHELPVAPGAVQEVGIEMEAAAEQRINQQRLQQILTDPVKHFREARIKFEEISSKLDSLSKDESFDVSDFKSELEKVTKVLGSISEKANQMPKE